MRSRSRRGTRVSWQTAGFGRAKRSCARSPIIRQETDDSIPEGDAASRPRKRARVLGVPTGRLTIWRRSRSPSSAAGDLGVITGTGKQVNEPRDASANPGTDRTRPVAISNIGLEYWRRGRSAAATRPCQLCRHPSGRSGFGRSCRRADDACGHRRQSRRSGPRSGTGPHGAGRDLLAGIPRVQPLAGPRTGSVARAAGLGRLDARPNAPLPGAAGNSRTPCPAVETLWAAPARGSQLAAERAVRSRPRAARPTDAGHLAWLAAARARLARAPRPSHRLRCGGPSVDTDGERKPSISIVTPRSWQNKDVR